MHGYTCWNEDIVMLNNWFIKVILLCYQNKSAVCPSRRMLRSRPQNRELSTVREASESPHSWTEQSRILQSRCTPASPQCCSWKHTNAEQLSIHQFSSSDASHYSHSNTSVACDYYTNTGLKWHTPFPACTQTLTHKTSLTLVHSANKADSPVLPSSGPVQGQEQSFFSHLHTTQRL